MYSHLLVAGWRELYRLYLQRLHMIVVNLRTIILFPNSTDRVFEGFADGLRCNFMVLWKHHPGILTLFEEDPASTCVPRGV